MAQQPQEQLIKTYKPTYGPFAGGSAAQKFAKDAAKLAQEGWRVQSQSSAQIGKSAFHSITVVYVR